MRKIIYLLLVSVGFLVFPRSVYAHCPLCVAGAGAGLTLSRVVGIDDSITGIWMAAFLGASAFWVNNLIRKRYVPFQGFFIYIFVFLSTIASFYRFGLVNEHNGLILNLPKLIFGMLLGGGIFYFVDKGNNLIIKKMGRVLFPYQSIAFSLGSMLILSLGIYILINYYI